MPGLPLLRTHTLLSARAACGQLCSGRQEQRTHRGQLTRLKVGDIETIIQRLRVVHRVERGRLRRLRAAVHARVQERHEEQRVDLRVHLLPTSRAVQMDVRVTRRKEERTALEVRRAQERDRDRRHCRLPANASEQVRDTHTEGQADTAAHAA